MTMIHTSVVLVEVHGLTQYPGEEIASSILFEMVAVL